MIGIKFKNIERLSVLVILLCLVMHVSAQDSSTLNPDSLISINPDNFVSDQDSIRPKVSLIKVDRSHLEKGTGTLNIIQDERINTLNDIVRDRPYKHEGFRIQVVFGSQGTVNSAKGRFQGKYTHATYKDYLAPNFRLRVGDFPTKHLAEKHLNKIKKDFPKAYIVKDKINSPRELRR